MRVLIIAPTGLRVDELPAPPVEGENILLHGNGTMKSMDIPDDALARLQDWGRENGTIVKPTTH